MVNDPSFTPQSVGLALIHSVIIGPDGAVTTTGLFKYGTGQLSSSFLTQTLYNPGNKLMNEFPLLQVVPSKLYCKPPSPFATTVITASLALQSDVLVTSTLPIVGSAGVITANGLNS